jgi:hypothetical protein
LQGELVYFASFSCSLTKNNFCLVFLKKVALKAAFLLAKLPNKDRNMLKTPNIDNRQKNTGKIFA